MRSSPGNLDTSESVSAHWPSQGSKNTLPCQADPGDHQYDTSEKVWFGAIYGIVNTEMAHTVLLHHHKRIGPRTT